MSGKTNKNFLLPLIILIVISGLVNAYSGAGGTCSCGDGTTELGGNATDACADCSDALNDDANCNVVNYVGTLAISNYEGECIEVWYITDKIFDCQGHTIDGYNEWYDGIYADNTENLTIKNCVLTDWGSGIFIWRSPNSNIINNSVSSNYEGIYLDFSPRSTITNNNVSNNDEGIFLEHSLNNTINNNNINSNDWYGIYLAYSSDNTITNNNVSNNVDGIRLDSSLNNTITNNNVNYNSDTGIYLEYNSDSNNIYGNNITNSYDGIYLSTDNITYAGGIKINTGTYGLVYLSFGFEAINNQNDRDIVMNRTINYLGNGNILLVDDDQWIDETDGTCYNWLEDNIEKYYVDALDNNGISYTYWNICSDGSPTYNHLNSYDIIIWFVGFEYPDAAEQGALEQYLGNGGNLFITGQDIGYYLIDEEEDDGFFYSTYLHANYAADVAHSWSLYGVDSGIGNNLNITITGGDGADNQGWPSGILPINGAEAVFYYDIVYPEFNNIYDNNIRDNYAGIFVNYGNENNIYNNNIGNNNNSGIFINHGNENDIGNNNISNNISNNNSGISINHGNENNIDNNNISNNKVGIFINYGNESNITNNNISNNKIGIFINYGNGSNLNENYVCKNTLIDIEVFYGIGNTGNNNACNMTYNYNDTGVTGCSVTCKGVSRICDLNDLNYDGIYIQDYNDLMNSYKCFLGINKNNCNNYYQNWNLMKQEYKCFANNKQ